MASALPELRPPSRFRTRRCTPAADEDTGASRRRATGRVRLAPLVIAALGLARLWLLDRLRIVVLAVLGALLLSVIPVPPARWLRSHGWPSLAATWAAFGGFVATPALAGLLIAPAASSSGRLAGGCASHTSGPRTHLGQTGAGARPMAGTDPTGRPCRAEDPVP
jgi:hypothetical protein